MVKEARLTLTGMLLFSLATGAVAGLLSSLPLVEVLCAAWFYGAGFLTVLAIKAFSGGRWQATEKEAVIIGGLTGASAYVFQLLFALIIELFGEGFSFAEALGIEGMLLASESTVLVYMGYLVFTLAGTLVFTVLGGFTAKTVLFKPTYRSSSGPDNNSLQRF